MEVCLHLYDLSQGMARQLSLSFIGKQIDYIPHTGVVVYGQEYFFGGGIQCMPPGEVVAMFGIRPIETIPMGVTHIDKESFHAFLRGISGRFTQATYNLLTHNCNNFSNEVCLFLLGRSIPEKILTLPGEFLSTPMGQMLAPMMQNMQNNMSHSSADHSVPLPQVSEKPRLAVSSPAPPLPLRSLSFKAVSKPFFSASTEGADAMGERLTKAFDGLKASLTDEERSLISFIPSFVSHLKSGKSLHSLPRNFHAFIVTRVPPTAAFAALYFLRLDAVVSKKCYDGAVMSKALGFLGTSSSLLQPPQSLLALTLLLNLFTHDEGVSYMTSSEVADDVIQIALALLQSSFHTVRETAAALLFNYSLFLSTPVDPNELPELATQLLCGLLEAIDLELVDNVRYYRLLAAGKVLERFGPPAVELAISLGYLDIVNPEWSQAASEIVALTR